MPATLASLRIRNFALVEDLLWEPLPGFTAITGETGAGKSVLIGALVLLLGERADKTAIRTGCDSSSVEAVFEGVTDARIVGALDEAGAEPCEEGRLLLKRVVPAAGTGRQFANGSPCTIGLLRTLGDLLVDLHGPHDHQSLFSRDRQTRLLDAFAGLESLFAQYTSARKAWLGVLREQEELAGDGGSLHREVDLLEHQIAEIESAGLNPGEEEVLLARHRAAANTARITELCATLTACVEGEASGLIDVAADAVRTTREIAKLDPAGESLAAAAEAAATAASELSAAVDSYTASFDADPETLAATEARLDVIGSLKRKYGSTLDDVMAFAESAATRLDALKKRLARAQNLDEALAAAAAELHKAGSALAAARQSAAARLEKMVSAALADLGFARSGFFVRLETLDQPGPLGTELVEFVFAPNPGEEPRPLRAIASSGEISRVMLALKGVLAAQDEVPLLVFDEIDANVGGEIATRVAARMHELSRGRQVFCITHLPQVAAAAESHLVVRKEITGGRTRTLLEPVQNAGRVGEIARMLGGQTAAARAHAEELLSGAPCGPPPHGAKRPHGKTAKR